MSFESIMNFSKKIPSSVSLIASIEFKDSFGVEFYNGFMNEIWEVGRIVTHKPYLSDQIITVYAILNPDTSLLASNLYYLLNSECIKCIYQANLVYSLLS